LLSLSALLKEGHARGCAEKNLICREYLYSLRSSFKEQILTKLHLAVAERKQIEKCFNSIFNNIDNLA
jgi:hypothetical protein